jgi:hypothetical protein
MFYDHLHIINVSQLIVDGGRGPPSSGEPSSGGTTESISASNGSGEGNDRASNMGEPKGRTDGASWAM